MVPVVRPAAGLRHRDATLRCPLHGNSDVTWVWLPGSEVRRLARGTRGSSWPLAGRIRTTGPHPPRHPAPPPARTGLRSATTMLPIVVVRDHPRGRSFVVLFSRVAVSGYAPAGAGRHHGHHPSREPDAHGGRTVTSCPHCGVRYPAGAVTRALGTHRRSLPQAREAGAGGPPTELASPASPPGSAARVFEKSSPKRWYQRL